MLKIINLEVAFGTIVAVREANLEIKAREFVAIVGPNGAGKSSTLRAIAGLQPASKGDIFYRGQNITAWPSQMRVKHGIVLVPEGRQLFGSLSVNENLLLGTYARHRSLTLAELARDLDEVFELFPVLKLRRDQPAVTLSGGEQQMLAIGRGLMCKPSLFLLDEPSLGLAPILRQEIVNTLSALRVKRGMTIVLVEQDINLAVRSARRGYVMQAGRMVAEGPSEDLLRDPLVQDVYLGAASPVAAN